MDLHITRPGTKIAVKDGVFEVSWFDDNNTLQKESHSPLKVERLWVQDGAVLSTAAILLAMQHNIDVAVLDRHGMPLVRCYGDELHTTPAVQKAQVMVSVGSEAVTFVLLWTAQKLRNQALFLEKLKSRRDSEKQQLLTDRAKEIEKLRKQLLLLDGKQVKDIAESLRGYEGAAGQVYFQTLSDVLPDEYRFAGRSRMPARDPFNAFLNYGFAVLAGKTEQALRMAGINPYIGFLHRDDYRLKSMVYDFIEPYRVWVERVVFRLFSRKLVNSSHTEAFSGGLQLNQEGIKLLMENFKEFLDEKKEELDGRWVSREYFLRQAGVRFGRRLIQIVQKGGDGIEAFA